MVDSVSVRFKNARVEKMPLNIRMQWNAGTACVSECVLKTLACRGLRVGPSKEITIKIIFERSSQIGQNLKAKGLQFPLVSLDRGLGLGSGSGGWRGWFFF